ncbi:hypothetical protein [Planctomicrobium sp. SH664]|uniref:hypothetical protein n=1 Tax=Planctomicrobium sp. SH664 TaxID=3448125 RepID=UPI003F5BD324
MNSRSDYPLDFYRNLQAFSLGEASDAQIAEVEKVLSTDPQARQIYYDLLDVDQGMHEIAAAHQSLLGETMAPPTHSPRRWPYLGYVLTAVTSAVIALGMVWAQWGIAPWMAYANQQTLVIAPSSPALVATVVQSKDCVWAQDKSPLLHGSRLTAQILELQSGLLELRFDSGIRVILEGPAEFQILSRTSARLVTGKAVLHCQEFATEFELMTPTTTVYDIGTEYGVAVAASGDTEVHVFSGAIQVEHSDAELESEFLEAGHALKITAEGMAHITMSPEQFHRGIKIPAPTAEPQGELIAYDGFQRTEPPSKWQSGGFGWADSWIHQAGRQALSRAVHLPETSLEFVGRDTPESRGALKLAPARNIARRTLARPIRMDEDSVYYVSFYFQKEADLDEETLQYGSLSLRTTIAEANGSTRNRRILFGVNSERMPIVSHNAQNFLTAPPISLRESCFFVAKIVTGKTTPDQVLMRIFPANSPIPDAEPFTWTCMTEPSFDDTVFDTVLLYTTGAEFIIDEIRIGTSWHDAVDTSLSTHTPLSPEGSPREIKVRQPTAG